MKTTDPMESQVSLKTIAAYLKPSYPSASAYIEELEHEHDKQIAEKDKQLNMLVDLYEHNKQECAELRQEVASLKTKLRKREAPGPARIGPSDEDKYGPPRNAPRSRSRPGNIPEGPAEGS